MISGLDHVQITIPEQEEHKARAFYHGVLGLKELEKPKSLSGRGGCWFACGSQQLHLGVERPFKPSQKAHPAFAVEHIDTIIKALETAGHPCTRQPEIPDARRIFAKDPFGNRIEFIERI